MLAFLSMTSFALLLADSAVAVGLTQMARSLNAGLADAQWIFNAYTVSFAAVVLLAGSLADAIGGRRVLNVGLLVFAAGSLAAAVAPTSSILIAARVVQGVGAAFVTPAALSTVIRAYPPPRQAFALGVWAGVSTVALGIGPMVGAVVSQGLGWRWLFLINVPIAAIALVAALALLPGARGQGLRRFDLPGAATSAAGLALLLFALSSIGAQVTSRQTMLVSLTVGFVFLVAFVFLERRAPAPLLDLAILRRSNVAAGNAMALLSTMLMCGVLVFMSMYLQDTFRHSALTTGAALLALTLPLVLLAPVMSRLMRLMGRRWLIAVGLGVLAIGLAGLSVSAKGEEMGRLVVFLVVAGVGSGLSITPITSISVEAVEPRQAGLASALLNTSRTIGLALGVSVMGAILNAQVSTLSKNAADFASGLATGFLAYAVLAAVTAVVALVAVRGESALRH